MTRAWAESGLLQQRHGLFSPFPEFKAVLLGGQVINGPQLDDLATRALGEDVRGGLLVVLAGGIVSGDGYLDIVFAAGDVAFIKTMNTAFGQCGEFLLGIEVVTDMLAVERQVDVDQPDR